jgi:DNA-binding response OmpR family regulator
MGTNASATSNSIRGNIIRILHLDDTPNDSELCLLELKKSQFDASVEVVRTAQQFSSHLSSKQYDVILADYQLHGSNGMHAFEIFRKLGYKAPFIFVTDAIGEEKVAECMR